MKRLLSFSIGILISTFLSFSQFDTIVVSSGVKDSIDMKYDRIYKLFLQDKSHDVRHLWKVSLVGFDNLTLNLIYEQKIGNNWSNESFIGLRPFVNLNSERYYCTMRVDDRIKYYYNLARRERLGKNTIGFSGNYFGLGGSVNRDFSSNYYYYTYREYRYVFYCITDYKGE